MQKQLDKLQQPRAMSLIKIVGLLLSNRQKTSFQMTIMLLVIQIRPPYKFQIIILVNTETRKPEFAGITELDDFVGFEFIQSCEATF